jgi:hypothetical protein
MSIIMDIWRTVHGIITSADTITLVIMAVIALGAGFMMQSLGAIITTTFVALLAFSLATYVRAVVAGHQNAAAFAQTDWHYFLGLQMLTLVAYALTFGVIIAVVHFARSLIQR